MIRTTSRALLVALTLALAWVAPAQAAADQTRITSYDAVFDVDASGSMHVVETLSVNLPIARHGIFRTFAPGEPGESANVPREVHITRDGAAEPFARSTENEMIVLKIGRASVTLTGAHVYVIEYTVDDVLTSFEGGSRLFWSLIPSGWDLRIARSSLRVSLPTVAQQARCGVGNASPCSISGEGSRELTVRTGSLAPGTPVTVSTVLAVSSSSNLLIALAGGAIGSAAA